MKAMNAILIKIDRNGSKHYDGRVECDRCQGRGWYATGVCNGELVPARPDDAMCYKCLGAGWVDAKWIERTPEYQAKLDAKREAKRAAERAKWEAENAERIAREREEEAKREAERIAREQAEAARKAISQHVGNVGDRISAEVTLERKINVEVPAFGFGTQWMTIYTFSDHDGNKLVWKTSGSLGRCVDEGEAITIKGTIKKHGEYKGEKQTELQRVKLA